MLAALLKGYLENLHAAKQELSIAFTNEAFAHLVQVSPKFIVFLLAQHSASLSVFCLFVEECDRGEKQVDLLLH